MTGGRSAHRFMMRAALAAAHLLAWVFIFHFSYYRTGDVLSALISVSLAYALTQVIIVLLTPWSAARIAKGIRRTMVIGTLTLATAFITLGLALMGSFGNVGVGIATFAILMGVYRAFYWVPYATGEHVKSSHAREIVLALIPLLAGFAVAAYGEPSTLLFGAAILVLASLVPQMRTDEQYERFSWSYRGTFHELFTPARSRTMLTTFLDGFEGAALLLIWPIVVFVMFGWSYALLGAVLSISLFGVYIARLMFGNTMKEVSPAVHMAVGASAWILRLVVASPVSVILVDLYHRGGRNANADHLSMEQVADNHTYVDEQTALREMGLALGRMALALAVAVLAIFGSLPVVIVGTFILAALATMSVTALKSAVTKAAF